MAVTLAQFRRRVQKEFGADLRHMTPANIREFLDRVETESQQQASGKGRKRVFLNETEKSYEGIVRSFLAQTLEVPPDQAVVKLWLFCLELASAGVNEIEAERFERLFGDTSFGPDPGEDPPE
jgi:hypothetical protein